MINVLSVDWDYFVDCSSDDRLLYFPDGGSEEIGLSLSLQIWSMCYANSIMRNKTNSSFKRLSDIQLRRKEFDFLKKCISDSIDSVCNITLADSHADIYDFILEHDECSEPKSLNIYNIDHHSDCYNIGSELNCGNWVNKLDDMGLIGKYTWVRDDRKEKFNLSCEYKCTNKLNIINGVEWDYIFICRSSIWSPPHLDVMFNELYDFFMYDCYLKFNEKFFIDRYSLIEKDIAGNAEQVKALSKMLKEVSEHNKKCDCTEDLKKIKEILNKK